MSGDIHFGRGLINGDDRMRADQDCALEDIEPDAAAAVHGDALARFDLCGIEHCADAGGHRAAD